MTRPMSAHSILQRLRRIANQRGGNTTRSSWPPTMSDGKSWNGAGGPALIAKSGRCPRGERAAVSAWLCARQP